MLLKVFTVAVRHEAKAKANPREDIERFALENQRVRYLIGDEEKRLFDAMRDNEQLKDIVTVALHTGMRRSEILNLKWFDLDFECGAIYVRKTTIGLYRVVPMNPQVREVFNTQKRSSNYVFASTKTGGRLMDVKRLSTPALEPKKPDFQLSKRQT